MELDKDVEWKNKNIQNNSKIVSKIDQKQKYSGQVFLNLFKFKIFKETNGLKQTFLNWLRKPNNAKLYNDILTLNPVLLVNIFLLKIKKLFF
jgi:hypothetical protein